jgi:pimeloyl-ACP methyl ester carboxylesterase
MQYAINKLGFMPDNIALFAWSIGGYSATWAAMNYPDISFVVSHYMVQVCVYGV